MSSSPSKSKSKARSKRREMKRSLSLVLGVKDSAENALPSRPIGPARNVPILSVEEREADEVRLLVELFAELSVSKRQAMPTPDLFRCNVGPGERPITLSDEI